MYGTLLNVNPHLFNPTGGLGGLFRRPDQSFDIWKVGGPLVARPIDIAMGQVLKARTWLQKGRDNRYEAYNAFQTSILVTLVGNMAATDTVTIAGIRFTAGRSLNATQVARAFATYSLLNDGNNLSTLGSNPNTSIGTWDVVTAGLFANWSFALDQQTVIDNVAGTSLIVSANASGVMSAPLPTATRTGTITISQALRALAGDVFLYVNASIVATNTITIAGVTYTASATNTPMEIVRAFANTDTSRGTFAGTNVGFSFHADSNSNVLRVSPTVANTTSTPLIVSSNVTPIPLTIEPINISPVAGILMFDVNATAGPVTSQAYVQGSFWYEGCKWKNNPGLPVLPLPLGAGVTNAFDGFDYVINADGTATACTAYWTGVDSYRDALTFTDHASGNSLFKLESWELTQGDIHVR